MLDTLMGLLASHLPELIGALITALVGFIAAQIKARTGSELDARARDALDRIRKALLEQDWPAKSFMRMRLLESHADIVGRMPNPLSAAANAGQPPAWMSFLPLVAMGFIFWFLILRPQMRQQKEHRAKIAGLKRNDVVVTAGGLVGKVIKVDETFVELELGTNVRVKAIKATLGDIIPPGGKPAND